MFVPTCVHVLGRLHRACGYLIQLRDTALITKRQFTFRVMKRQGKEKRELRIGEFHETPIHIRTRNRNFRNSHFEIRNSLPLVDIIESLEINIPIADEAGDAA